MADQLDDVDEELGHQKGAGPIEARGHAGGAAPNFGRQNLAHHEPGDRAEPKRETNYVDDETRQRDVSVLRDVHILVLHIEENTKYEQGHKHADAAHVQEDLTAEAVDQGRSDEGRGKINYAYDDRADVRVDAAACVLGWEN